MEHHHAKVTNEARVYKVAKMIRNYRYVARDSINEVRNDDPDPIISSGCILIKAAQRSKTVVVPIGHVNRDGDIFGPMKTEHLVHAVCVIEKDEQDVRTIRVEKSRMGRAGNAVLLMTMGPHGLELGEGMARP